MSRWCPQYGWSAETAPFGTRPPLRKPTDAERIAALERRVKELERRLGPLDCIGPDGRQGRGKAGA